MNDLVKTDPAAELDFIMKVANIFMKSGKFGKDCNLETIALMIMYSRELGLGLASSCVNGFECVQGKVTMKPALMSNMIRRAGHSLQILKWEPDECVIKGKRADNGDELTISFTMEDAKRAGWDQKAVYKQNPKNMLYARAMGNLGRMLFGDVIGNPYASDEIFEPEKRETRLMTRPDETVEAVVSEVKDAPLAIGIHRGIDDLMEACGDIGVKYDRITLVQYILSLRDSKNAKGGKQVSDQDIVQSIFLPGMLDRFCVMFKTYLMPPKDEVFSEEEPQA